jgi:membrane protein YdbS with pleckstrin-like domain
LLARAGAASVAAVPFPSRLLTSDEEIVLDTRPHWIALAGPVAVTVLLVAALVAALVSIHGSGGGKGVLRWIVLAVVLVVFVAYPLRRFVQWATSHFVVTNERLIHRSGFIAKRSMEVPLNRINDVRFEQSVFERAIGAGDLVVESAGERGQEVFDDIRHPEEIQKVIYERAEAYQGRFTGMGAGAAQAPSVGEELQRLADLRDRGAITDAEFQAQKARLLGE